MIFLFLLYFSSLPIIKQVQCSIQYFKFADQAKAVLRTGARNYAVLKEEPIFTDGSIKAPLDEFTICSSVYIGYFRGHQAFYTLRQNKEDTLWFSLYINSQDMESGSYTSIFAYFGNSKFSNSKELKLKPHDWSHACTSLDRRSRRVFVAINGVLVHDQIVDVDVFWENFPPVFEGNLLLGVTQWQYDMTNTETTQSEASVTNLKIFKSALMTSALIELTSDGFCSEEGDYLSWANATWSLIGKVEKSVDVDFCTRETSPHLYLLGQFHLWKDCMSLCPRLHEAGRVPFVANVSHSRQIIHQFRNLSADYAWKPNDPYWLYSPFRQDHLGNFVDHYSEVAMPEGLWVDGQPNGGSGQPCTGWMGQRDDGRLFDTKCTWRPPGQCLCQFKISPVVRLRGLCSDSNIDTHFTFKYSNKSVLYKGLKGSEIQFSTMDTLPKWMIWTNGKNTTAISSIPETTYALGKNSWNIANDSLTCNEGKLMVTKLKLSSCKVCFVCCFVELLCHCLVLCCVTQVQLVLLYLLDGDQVEVPTRMGNSPATTVTASRWRNVAIRCLTGKLVEPKPVECLKFKFPLSCSHTSFLYTWVYTI